MKKIAMTVISIALCLLFFGCTARENPLPPLRPTQAPDAEARRETEAPTALPLTDDDITTLAPVPITDFDFAPLYSDCIVTHGDDTSGSSYKVYYDHESFKADFGDISNATGDRYSRESFDKMFVVAVKTTVNTGGWTVVLENASFVRGRVDVSVSVAPPDLGTNVTQAFETHWVLVAFSSENVMREDLEFSVAVNGTILTGSGEDM